MLSVDQLIESEGLFVTTFPEGISFTWRLLTLKEYKVFATLRSLEVMDRFTLHEKVFQRCYIGEPGALNGRLPVGMTMSIGELILYMSGDSAIKTEVYDIEQARDAYPHSAVSEHMKRICLLAFPSYTPEVIENWTRMKLIKTFTIAERILQAKYPGYELLDTSKIESASEVAKSNGAPIDFVRENRELSAQGLNQDHILDRPPEQLARQRALNRRQLRNLDKRRG